MYGPLLMLVIFIPLFLIVLFFAIAPYHVYDHYEEKRYYTDKNDTQHVFYDSEYDVKRLSKENPALLVKLQKNEKKRRFWYKLWDAQFIPGITAFVLGLVIFIFGLICIIAPIEARNDMAVWTEFAEMAEETFENAEEYEKYGIAGDVAEYNKWLAEARASKKLYGNWSSYYFCDIDSLRPISLGK
jgi:hypothetical protein